MSVDSEFRAGGVIHDIGYRHYDQPRLSPSVAARSLGVDSLRGAFGLWPVGPVQDRTDAAAGRVLSAGDRDGRRGASHRH